MQPFTLQQTLTLRRTIGVEYAKHELVYIPAWGQGFQQVFLGGMWLKFEKHGEIVPYTIMKVIIFGFRFIKVTFDLFDLMA